ncbi:MAG TPA: hypothetical protein VF190_10410, partial [Rhodothermales bacterium]
MSGSFFGSYFRRIDREEREQHAKRLQSAAVESEEKSAPDASTDHPAPDAPLDAAAHEHADAAPRQEPVAAHEPEHAEPAPAPHAPEEVPTEAHAEHVHHEHHEHDEQAESARRGRSDESPLDGLMRDKIVVALLQEDVISVPQALLALQRQKRRTDTALWRIVAEMKDVDSEVVFAHAAKLQGFETAHITPARPSDELIEAVQGLFAPHVARAMTEMGLLPYDFVLDAQQKRHTLVFACNDPGSADVRAFIDGLGAEVELRFAPTSVIAERMQRKARHAHDAEAAREEEIHLRDEAARELERKAEEASRISARRAEEAQAEWHEEADGSDDDRPTLSSDDLRKLLGTQPAPDHEVLVDQSTGHNPPTTFNGDGYSDQLPPSDPEQPADEPPRLQEDGHAGDAPELRLTDWTGGQDNGKHPQPEEAASAEPVNLDSIRSKDRVVAMLLKKSIIVPDQVERAQRKQKKEKLKEPLWRLIAMESGADRDAIFAEAARVYAFPIAQIGQGQPDAEFARSVVET